MPETDGVPGRPAAARRSSRTTTKSTAKRAKTAAAKKSAEPAKKTAKTAKTAPAKQSGPAKAGGKKTTGKKAGSKRAGKTVTAKPPGKRAPAKKSSAKKSSGKAPARKVPAKQTASTGRGSGRVGLPVLSGEAPWTKQEIAEVRGELETDRRRLLDEVAAAEQEIKVLLRDGGDGAGNDQADVGSKALERDAEMSLANNSREMLFQVDRALARLDDGTYGVCESCGRPIGKLRLMVFPRATLCVSCKQRQERR